MMWPQAQENWGSRQNLEEARNVFSPRSTPGSIALLDLNFKPPELGWGGNAFLLVLVTKFVVICYSSLRKLNSNKT